MNTTSIPQELTNIPFGQIFILTNPKVGITAKTIKRIEFIHSMARQYKQKSHVVNAIVVDHPELGDCFICKVKTEEGVQILVSDKDALVEMLCEFWELDYEEVCKSIRIPAWHKKNKGVTIGGESHPVRVSLKPVGKPVPGMERKDGSIFMEMLPDHSEESVLMRLKGAFQDIFNHDLEVSFEDITALYEEVKKDRKKYKLDIHFDWEDEKTDEDGNTSRKIKSCTISLIDNLGKHYSLDKTLMQAQVIALYLTFILFKEGLTVQEISYNKEFYETFIKILGQLPRGYNKPNQFTLWENAKSKLSVIRRAIWNATKDNYAKEMFAADGYSEDIYIVAGATEEDRAKIREVFGLE